ncbi:hypothetical protein EN943_28855 [Mesorhizobium sp. M7A.F.Ca.US.006.01.1.1]|uniref:COG3904 family protein n=1 Tax=Mesorhizobium sp. M7A.F.Ca.US.006.01.1.1 TaxID=2496707 RepID=UPI000FCC9F99|nr:hypothetical protein [Mesorhizobium sp. M7A.F.Ca.US.006.01.1.1]RUZ72917.1 hypothetical protein EN943_28855 [Mesorhizobium sp. M7A.F.Ca.US.006.01.1.1]
MQVVVVRSNATGCEPSCPEWISAEGAITAGTPAQLKRILKTLGRRKLPIVVNSPGGNVDAALQLGRIIRKNKLDIAIGTTKFSDCWPGMEDCRANDGKGAAYFGMASDGGAMCNSACPLMFAGGVRRVAGGWAYLGVHQITTTYFPSTRHYRTTYRVVRGKKYQITTETITPGESYKTYEMSKALARKLSAYLREMGVGQGVLDTMKATPASDIRQITLHDMLSMKLATSTDTVDLFASASLCMLDKLAPNCREIPANKPAGGETAAAKLAKAATIKAKTAPSEKAEAPPSQPAKALATKPFEPAPGNGVPEMRFVVVRGSDPLCNPDCPEWISAEGAITPQTPQRLRELLAVPGNQRLPLLISSRGGDLFSALTAGRLIHERKLAVAVARTNIVGCDAPQAGCLADNGAYVGLVSDFGVECDSACALMLAGGTKRLVDPKARLSMYSMGQKQIVQAYLKEMAINPGLFAAIGLNSVERQLEPDMMLKVGLVTGPESADALTGAAICRSSPKADNCRLPPAANAEANALPKL